MGQFDELMDRIAAELDEMKQRLRPRREELQSAFEQRSDAHAQPGERPAAETGQKQKNLPGSGRPSVNGS